MTPLHVAAKMGASEVADLLVRNEADTELRDESHRSALEDWGRDERGERSFGSASARGHLLLFCLWRSLWSPGCFRRGACIFWQGSA